MMTSILITAAGFVGTGGGIYVAGMFISTLAALLKSTLGFLRSPAGMVAGAFAGACVLYVAGWVGGDLHGTNKTRAEWRAARVLAEKAWLQREATIRQEMRGVADRGLSEIGNDDNAIDKREKDYEASSAG